MTAIASASSTVSVGTHRSAFRRLLATETKLSFREPIGLILGLIMPVVLFLIFAAIPAFRRSEASLGGLTRLDIYVPILIAFVLAMIALVGLPAPLANYRGRGVLRRMSTTPASPALLLAARAA